MPYPSEIEQKLAFLERRFGQLANLGQALSLLEWDSQTYLPEEAAESRGRQMATLEGVIHEKLTDKEVGKAIEALGKEELEPTEAALLRLYKRRFDQEVRLPGEFVEAYAQVRAASHQAWLEAREKNRFDHFAPHLSRVIEFSRKEAEYLGYQDHPYDALHDLYEPGSTRQRVSELFGKLRPRLVELVQSISQASEGRRDGVLRGEFDPKQQEAFVLKEVRRFGFDFSRGRLDLTVHPFAQDVGRDDVRITTRYHEDFLASGIFSAFPEAGHGLYEQGTPAQYSLSPLGESVSLAVHESQSRMWENLIGRSRAYWRRAYPQLQEHFPQLDGVDLETFYRAVNHVEPSLIRVDADEVTYNLHVMIRFELEQQLLDGSLEVASLPGKWNELYEQYLGVQVPSDLEGCLQDVHWSMGLVGYFPTYTMGNVISVQLWEKMREDLGDLDARLEAGEFGEILGWLRSNIHEAGSRYLPEELVERATGRAIDPQPYLDYLYGKYGELYGFTGEGKAPTGS